MKIAVVTGASRGLGLVIAKEFQAHDWQVMGTGRSARPGELSSEIEYRQFDASDAPASEGFWKEVHDLYPDAEVCLVNNAGGYVYGSLTETTPEDFATQMRSSYFSAAYMTRGLAVVYDQARIVNIISSSALAPHKNDSAYGAAKAAEKHFFQSLQKEYALEQYRITNIYPTDIATRDPNPKAIVPADLAAFVRAQAENSTTYHLQDVTMHAVPH